MRVLLGKERAGAQALLHGLAKVVAFKPCKEGLRNLPALFLEMGLGCVAAPALMTAASMPLPARQSIESFELGAGLRQILIRAHGSLAFI